MTKTVQDVRVRALHELGVIGVGQTITADDANDVDVMATAERLAAERIVDLVSQVDSDAIEDGYFLHLARAVAGDHGAVFGVPPDVSEALRIKAEARLSHIVRRDQPPRNLVVEYR